jgi:hypothetical protein
MTEQLDCVVYIELAVIDVNVEVWVYVSWVPTDVGVVLGLGIYVALHP